MLAQTYVRDVIGRDARIARTLVRDAGRALAVVRARGIAVDHGVLRGAVGFVRGAARTQLTIVLRGRGYIATDRGTAELREGDVELSDQRAHVGEGYGGRESEIVIVEWEGSVPQAAGRLSPIDRERLRARMSTPSELVASLAELGLPTPPPREPRPTPTTLARLYAALGSVLSRLDTHPNLGEVAAAVGGTERTVHRQLAQLAAEFAHPFAGWRDLLNEMRLDLATQLLSIPSMPLAEVAARAGYRSTIALHHALSSRNAPTATAIARTLRERW
jgi:AraC-like DNA-binding protein